MNLKLRAQQALAALALAMIPALADAQGCMNSSSYGSAVPDAGGALTTISTCNYMQEYSTVGPVIAGAAYQFTITGNGYITVREGSAGGTVLDAGYSPLTVTPTQNGTLYVHWNVNEQCATSSGCQTTTVQLFLNCTPPVAMVTAADDCDNNQFTLNVDVLSLGDADALDLVYNVNGGANQTDAGVGLGVHTLGPFTVGATVNLVIEHDSDPACNLVYNGLVSNNTCPIIVECGGDPLDQTYCYINYDNNHWKYESSSGEALILIFSAGSIESNSWDHLRIYNGPDNQSPLLWENPSGTFQLAGVQVTGGSVLYMENSSDGSSSCESGTQTEWVWQVGCLDCTSAEATFEVVTDCDNYEFSVDVTITELGSDPTLDIVDAATGDILETATATGTYTVGPFTANIPVVLTLSNSDNSLCNVSSQPLVNPMCPQIIQCGGAPVDDQYCYGNNDFHEWSWESSTGDALIMIFSAGTIESGSWDHIRIYNGNSNTAPLLYENGTGTTNLAGLQVIASSGMIYMEMSSDGSNSCQSGSHAQWVWQVGCLDCTSPEATFEVVTDCDNFAFYVDVDITELGSDPTLDIVDAATGDILETATATGTYTVGPFTANIPVVLTLSNSENSLCNVSSPALVNPMCPQTIQCGGAPVDDQYCYGNSDFHEWSWESSTGDALIIIFSAGSIESGSFDHIRIFNGNSNTAPLLYENGTGATQLAGLQAIATSGMMYMEMSSDGSVSCVSGSYDEWVWQVGCLDCSSAEATFEVVTDCDNFEFSVDVTITELGSDPTLDIVNEATGDILETATATGTYTVGPFTANIPVVITLSNSENSLCNISSTELVNPMCPQTIQCGGAPVDDQYCYGNNDFHEWSWASSTGDALIMIFSAGTIESSSWDHIRIYNGNSNTAPLLYENATGTTNLAGLQVIASSGMIYMEMSSDGSSSCQSGSHAQWVWQVGCLDCTSPTATFSVVTDCPNMEYSVLVDITELGSDPVLDITNNNGAPPVVATEAGTYTVGPFPAGTFTVITLENDQNPLCNISSEAMTNPLCPTVLACDGTLHQENYCYINNDNHTWHWQSSGGQPLAMEFSAGSIESASWDHLRIYDGPDNNSPLLFDHTQTSTFNLAGLMVISTGPSIYMENSSDGSVSCASGSHAEWVWTVGCLDCTNPGATFSLVEDCIHHNFYVAVEVDSLGSGDFVRIANTLSTDTMSNVLEGITMVGPFPMDSTVSLTVLNEVNDLCRVYSDVFTASALACVDTVCAPTAYEYCYTNNDTAWFAYQGEAGNTLTVTFLWGKLLVNDFVQVYNGLSPNPNNLRWQGNLNGDMSGWAVSTTLGYSSMLVRIVSDGSGSCETGEVWPPLHWVVGCGAVGVDELSAHDFSMYPNPTTGELSVTMPQEVRGTVHMVVTDLAGRTVHQEDFTSVGGVELFDLGHLNRGNYLVTITTEDWVKTQQLQIMR